MARELFEKRTKVVIKATDDTIVESVKMKYQVIDKDGTNDDLLEEGVSYTVVSPDYNQTVNAICTGVGTTVKTNESI